MPRFVVNGATSGRMWRWDAWDDYRIATETPNRITLIHEDGRGYQRDREAYRIDLVVDGDEVTRVLYRDGSGRILGRIENVDIDVDLARSFLRPSPDNPDDSNGRGLFDYIMSGGSVYVGGNTSNDQFDRHDDLTTGRGDDTVLARSGNDFIKDGGGKDVYRGGSGEDEVTYDELFWKAPWLVQQGLVANLARGIAVGPDGNVDRLISIEGIRGTFLDDRMIGNARDYNSFAGGQGADFIDGRGGFDIVRYNSDHWRGGDQGITARLDRGLVIDGFGDRDVIRNVEGVSGTRYRDVFVDNARNNFFDGREGNDLFLLSGGDDAIRGREGADRFVFRGRKFGEDEIRDFNPDEGDRIVVRAADGIDDLTIRRDDDDTIIRLNGASEIRLEDFSGPLNDALLF